MFVDAGSRLLIDTNISVRANAKQPTTGISASSPNRTMIGGVDNKVTITLKDRLITSFAWRARGPYCMNGSIGTCDLVEHEISIRLHDEELPTSRLISRDAYVIVRRQRDIFTPIKCKPPRFDL